MKYLSSLSALILLTACGGDSGSADKTAPKSQIGLDSQVISRADVKPDSAPWGQFYAYFTEDTVGISPVLVGVADIREGQQIHPPHRHGDEEFLVITQGRGIWHLNGRDFKAAKGDILYAKPWDYHGVKADGDSPLQFVVFKFSSKGTDVADPDPSLPEELGGE